MTDRTFAATSAQERFWVLQSLAPDSGAYTVVEAIRIRGALDAAALGEAFGRLLAAHGQLRATFGFADGVLMQTERAAANVPAGISRHRVAPEEVDGWLRAESARGFDLANGPLFRAHLLDLEGDRPSEDRLLVLSVHHIVSDGWSSALFFRQLGEAYDAIRCGVPHAPRAGDYAALVARERDYLASPAHEDDLERAARALEGRLAPLDLPANGQPRRLPSAGTVRAEIPAALEARLDALARRIGVSKFMLYLAGWGVLLGRYSGQASVAVALPFMTRDPVTEADTYGVALNTVVVPVDARAGESWARLLVRVRDAASAAFETGAVPFDRLLARLEAGPPQAMLVVQPDVCTVPAFEGLETAWHFVGNAHPKFDVLLQIDRVKVRPSHPSEPGERLFAALEHRADTISEALAGRMLESWQRIMTAIADDPDAAIASIDTAGAADRLLRAGLLRADVPLDPIDPVAAFAAVAANMPATTAIHHDGARTSYAALAGRVAAIADALAARGIGAGDFVGVCLRRTPDLVATLLAVLDRGAAYVPLDPAYPADRLDYIARDASCALIVCEAATRAALPAGTSAFLDLAAVPAAAGGGFVAAPARHEAGTAYLIYTSGSTGRPKGVVIPHRALRAFLGWARTQFAPDEIACVLASTSVCFDLSVFEIFLPLSLGGAIRLAETAMDLVDRPEPVPSLINTVPSAMTELAQLGALAPATKVVNLAGEPLTRRLCDAVFARLPDVRLCNLYGPSEDTTYSTWAEIAADDRAEPSIGVPIAGTNGYVLDEGLRPVPAGAAGELFLGGDGVALGYLGRPALTAERFLPDPFLPGRRMYRTGDRVALQPDGNLRYLGRNDHQIKLRGFRIETPEIESVAQHVAGVERAIVTVCEVAGSRQLAIYWTGGAAEGAVRDALRRALPAHMVPARYVPLATFPLNANGKIDRARLPAPVEVAPERVVEITPGERQVAEIVAELTRATAVDGDTDFFECGGHSLLAMRLIALVQDRLGVRLTLAEMFGLRTVRAIAARIERAASAPAEAPPLAAMAGDGPAPLSYAQERIWMVDRLRAGSTMLNIGVGTAIDGPLDVRALRAAIGTLTRRHAGLRLRVAEDAGGTLRQFARPDDRAFLQEATVHDEAARDALLGEALATPFDLTTESPARWILVREPTRAVLALVIHHLAADAWSVDVLMRELWEAYESARAGATPAADPEPVPSALDYALWQRRLLDDPARRARELAYWREALAELPERLQLPFDHPPAGATRFSGGRLLRRLDAGTVDALATIARRAGASTFTGLLAVYQALLSRLSMQDDVVVGTPIANRDMRGAQSLVGCLLNTLALRADLSGRPSLETLVAQVQARALDAYRHQATPFELILSELDVPRAIEHTPVVQTMLVFNGDLATKGEAAGLVLTPVDIPPHDTQYDVTLMIGRDAEGWTATWDYRRDLFEPRTIEAFASRFETLLGEAVRAPARALHALPLTPAGATASADAREIAAPEPATLPALFAEQVARTPDAIAVEDPDGRTSYRDLDAAAEGLAARLAACGIGPEDRVAVLLPKSRASVLATIAIAKAGAAFLVLDPSLPQERLELIVEDAGIAALVTDADGAPRLSARVRHTLRLDEPAAPRPGPRPVPALSPDHLAYLIYTSGSTGRPKGVLVTHRGLAQLRVLHRDAYGTGPGSRVLQYAPPTFDAAVWDLVMALLTGACLHLAPPEDLLPGAPLAATLVARGITHLTLPPSNMAMVSPDCGHVLRNVTFAGEALPPDIVQRWSAIERIWNGYGPTETTVCATAGRCLPQAGEVAPGIGEALAGTRVHVLDEGLNPVPDGMIGELWVGGDGVARGYLGQPGRTAQSFRPDPFSDRRGARMYRTGDLVRRREDGTLAFVGRIDEQVKLRGIRIEIGEIEHVLADLDPAIGDAAIVVAGIGEERRLVGFVAGPETLDPAALHAGLARKLPGWMVPAWVQRLDAFPLTRNGKLDRKALVAAARPRVADVEAERPRGPVEDEICGIWRDLLPGVAIGRNDSFFALGGTSLLMIRLHEALDRRWKGALKPIDLFRLVTVADIAAALETAGAVEAEDALDFTFRL
ncbi:amino acid adenylation domain-containing protein [Salinarimonas chemoclinalis]|uniref:amino acid adenylation domain-containing protein n=1 Tax=Salinarimonas chemoclinalis TaxID=3241599 RepID=UPI003558D905